MSSRTSTILTTIGFLLFFFGMYSLALTMAHVQVPYLEWIDNWGGGIGLLIRIIMVMAGVICVVIAKSNFSGENDRFTQEEE